MAPTRIPPPGIANRIRRLAWQVTWLLLFRPSPVPLHAWRRLLLRAFGATVGAGAHPYPTARVWAPWNLVMEENSCLGAASDCYNVVQIILRKNCVVSQKAYLCSASHDVAGSGFELTAAPIEIGERAWVAAAAFIGPGVHLGAGAVAAACAVVVRDVAPGDIVAGNPASVVKRSGLNGDIAA